jgi:ATP-dependent DNA helicase RecQ
LITATDILKKYWGFDKFRPNQEAIINAVLAGKDTLALLPTGGGKSLCFQVPALMKDGICIVITPLIALMQDQISNLAQKGIKALAIYSGMSHREIDIALDNAVYGDYAFLYVSPERLQTELFITRFKKMAVNFIAVDEAHCISQWGHDFRPSYLKIADLKLIKPNLTFLALTATATHAVAEDIQLQLGFKDQHVIKSSFARHNLKYITLPSENKLDDIVLLSNKLKGSGIIYCGTRKNTKILWQYLNDKGISATFYHAGLDKEIRKARQEQWMRNEIRIMISTNAFGMGIDKPDVKFVMHADIPENLESYFQEAGRAGRDLSPARAVLYFDRRDTVELRDKVALRYPDLPTIKKIYNALGNHLQLAIGAGKDSVFNLNLNEFAAKYNLNISVTYNAIKLLEISNLISLSEHSFALSRMRILIDKIALYQYQVKNKDYNQLLQFIIRSHIGIFDNYLPINESIIAKKTKFSLQKVVNLLEKLKSQQVIDYIPKTKDYQLTYTSERLSDQNMRLPKDVYAARKTAAEKSVDAMISYLDNAICRQQFLLDYFGEQTPSSCGQCNVCLGLTSPSINVDNQQLIKTFILAKLTDETFIEISTIIKYFHQIEPDAIMQTIRWLNDQQVLTIDKSGQKIIR